MDHVKALFRKFVMAVPVFPQNTIIHIQRRINE